MIRTFKYLFSAPADLDEAPGKILRVAQHRCRVLKGLYGVVAVPEGKDLVVTLRVDGHGYFGARVRANREADVFAKVLRMGSGTVEMIEDRAEPTMRNLTVSQGRAQSYEGRTATRLRNRAERLRRFREENL
jgi:hypothetical protein